VATASAANEAFVRDLGADQFIDYRSTPFEQAVRDLDVVFDGVGGDVQARSFGVLRRGGRLVSIVEPPAEQRARAAGVIATMMSVQPNGARLAEALGLVAAGGLRVEIAETLPLSAALAALEKSRSGRTRGKLVLTV
jgi:NADPH:quinone reductase-like Zn-dependent oxidoreductase